MPLPKIIAIVGPTAVGKTSIALELAKKYHGEIVSADSRQIYEEMTVGTGKPTGVWREYEGTETYFVDGIAHYGLDFLSPKIVYSISEFKKYAYECIDAIIKRDKLPIVVGGTGLYIWAVVDNLAVNGSEPNKELRFELENLALPQLLERLQKIDPEGYAFVDKQNPRRVLRAIEIAEGAKNDSIAHRDQLPPRYETLQIGLTLPREELVQKIDLRIDEQIKNGFQSEAVSLLKKYDPALPSMSSIGYSQWAAFTRGELTESETVTAIKIATHRYAKRQTTWFKRDKRIRWFMPTEIEKIANYVKTYVAK